MGHQRPIPLTPASHKRARLELLSARGWRKRPASGVPGASCGRTAAPAGVPRSRGRGGVAWRLRGAPRAGVEEDGWRGRGRKISGKVAWGKPGGMKRPDRTFLDDGQAQWQVGQQQASDDVGYTR